MNRFSDAVFSRDALKTFLECAWAIKGQWKVFPEDKMAPTDPPPTAETCLQTILFLAGQLTVTVIVTYDDPADPTIRHRSYLRGAAFTPSFAEEAAAL